MAKIRIRKEDEVVVISGKDRDLSKPRRVLQVLHELVLRQTVRNMQRPEGT